MSKNLRQLLILVSILVLLIALYCCIVVYNSYQEKKAERDAEAAIVHIGNISSDLVDLEFYNGTDTLSFSYDSASSTWLWTEDKEFPVDNSIIKDINKTLMSLTSDKCLEITDDLSAYGLSPAVYTLTAKDADGNTIDLLVGNKSPSSGSAKVVDMSSTDSDTVVEYYYAMLKGGESIYVIPNNIVSSITSDLYDFVSVDEVPYADKTDFQSIVFSYNGQTFSMEKEVVNEEDVWYTYVGGKKVEVSSLEVTPSPDEDGNISDKTAAEYLKSALSAIDNFRFRSCYDYKASDSVLSEFGITDDSLTVTVTFQRSYDDEPTTYTIILSEESFEITLSNETNTVYYTKLADSKALNYSDDDYVVPIFDMADAFFAD